MFLRPRSLDEACAAIGSQPLAVLAGGTDFFPALGERPPPDRILDLSAIDALRTIAFERDILRIGAGVTWSHVLRTELPRRFAGLKAAAREVGSVQIQNTGTIAGNLCTASPAADGVPPLLTLDAAVELRSVRGIRTLPLSDFLRGYRTTDRRPDEIVTAILVPDADGPGRSAFVKLGARRYLVISIVSAAACLTVEDGRITRARVAVGSCNVSARRLPELEAALTGLPADAPLADRVRPGHLEPLAPIDDVRGSAEYRHSAAAELVGRALELCRQDA